MERRWKIVLGIAAAVIIVGVLVWLFRPRTVGAPAETPTTTGSTTDVTGSTGTLARTGGVSVAPPTPPSVDTPPPPPPAQAAVRQLAETFAERYGTFSSEGNFVNLTDLAPLMTERYQRETEVFVARERAKPRSAAFSSTTTVVIRTDVELADGEGATHARASVITQRTDIRTGAQARTYTQTLVLELIKIPEGWRVDRAEWESADLRLET